MSFGTGRKVYKETLQVMDIILIVGIVSRLQIYVKIYQIIQFAAASAKSLQLCLTLCDPIDGSPPSSAVPRILQARTLEWVAISFSNAWK